MTTGGWIFMLISTIGITALLAYTLWRTLRHKEESQARSK